MLFCGRGLKLFSPLRATTSKTTNCLLSYFFRLNTWNLKSNAKALAVDFLRLNILKRTKSAFLPQPPPLKGPTSTPSSLCGSPRPPGIPQGGSDRTVQCGNNIIITKVMKYLQSTSFVTDEHVVGRVLCNFVEYFE